MLSIQAYTNRTAIERFMLPLLWLAVVLAACDREREPTAPAADPTQMQPDLGDEFQPLVPAPIELAVPMVCGPFTVYDEEDVSTLCNPTTLAATPIVLPTCPQEVSGSVRLETNLMCLDTPGLIVTSDNTVIDLNGFKIVCTGVGYGGSCQGPIGEVDDDTGIDTNGHDNVHIFSHLPEGTIDGFNIGVHVRPNSDNIKVKQVTVTAPPGEEVPAPRPETRGIFVDHVDCANGHVRIGGGTNTGNDVSWHTRGIEVFQSACVYVGYNRVHHNGGSGLVGRNLGIEIASSSDNHIRSNVVTRNGDGNNNFDGGLRLSDPPTTGNLVVENQVNENDPYGVRTDESAADNYIVNNQMLFNLVFDAFSDQTDPVEPTDNRWNENNRCLTQTTPHPPPGVCSPDDAPPPQ
jgi:hypothetical protein